MKMNQSKFESERHLCRFSGEPSRLCPPPSHLSLPVGAVHKAEHARTAATRIMMFSSTYRGTGESRARVTVGGINNNQVVTMEAMRRLWQLGGRGGRT
uniref:Uncharacterized protein n=1 Tax=Leersia perrieri TaxID=77586 RepID=A0A0D9UY88_9ORYZ